MRTADGLVHHNAVRKRLLGAAITSVHFLDDHRVMRDFGVGHGPDWALDGDPFHQRLGGAHWTPARSYPASVTRGTRLRIHIELAPDPIDADPIDVAIVARATSLRDPAPDDDSTPFLTFEGMLRVGDEATGALSMLLSATGTLPDEVFAIENTYLRWSMGVGAEEVDLGSTGPHDLFVTYGEPDQGGAPHRPAVPGAESPAWLDAGYVPLEDGITHLRMREAVRATERMLRAIANASQTDPAYRDPDTGLPLDPTDPHTIVRAILGVCSGYTFTKDPLLAQFAHATYFNRDMGGMGAWPIAHHADSRAECQAIVRFVRAVTMAIGVPGEVEAVGVYARPHVGGGRVALVDSLMPMDTDPTKYRAYRDPIDKSTDIRLALGLHRMGGRLASDGVLEGAGLADAKVSVGDEYPEGRIFNSYEACLRFTHGGRTRYYGGGIPRSVYETPAQVLRVFRQLVWTRRIEKDTDERLTRVVEIVADYHDGRPIR